MTLCSSIYYPGVGTWHSDPHILSWYRNVAPDPYSILVSERDTRFIFYPGTGTWNPIHILSWCRNVTPDPYSILVPERGTQSIFYPGGGTWHSDPHILSWYRNVAPDPLISLLSFIKPSLIPRHHHYQSRLGFLFKIWDSIVSSCLFIHNYIITSFMQAYN